MAGRTDFHRKNWIQRLVNAGDVASFGSKNPALKMPNHEIQRLPSLSEFRIRWPVLISIIAIHLLAIPVFWIYNLSSIFTFLFLWFATGCWGITVGYHRMISHRSFSAPAWIRAFHMFWASISLQQGPISWARQHRAHHKYSDTMADPHPQKFGFWFGHIGWTFLAHQYLGRSPERKEIPADLARDPVLIFFEKYHLHFFFASLIVLYWTGGLPMLIWGGAFRVVWVLHITWAINSVVHRWGYRNFETNDTSVNNIPMALLAWGEGWHNNHHRYPFSAREGILFWEIDFSWLWIRSLEKLGLINDVRVQSKLQDSEDSKQK